MYILLDIREPLRAEAWYVHIRKHRPVVRGLFGQWYSEEPCNTQCITVYQDYQPARYPKLQETSRL